MTGLHFRAKTLTRHQKHCQHCLRINWNWLSRKKFPGKRSGELHCGRREWEREMCPRWTRTAPHSCASHGPWAELMGRRCARAHAHPPAHLAPRPQPARHARTRTHTQRTCPTVTRHKHAWDAGVGETTACRGEAAFRSCSAFALRVFNKVLALLIN